MNPLFSQAKPPKHICLLRLSAIGDVCHTVACVQRIQAQWPATTITWVIGKPAYALVAGLPGVHFIVVDKASGWRAYWQLYRRCRGHEFDALLHMQTSIRASLFSLCIRARHKIGFDRKRAKDGQWLFTNATIKPASQPHVLDGLLSFTETLGLTATTPTWHLPIPVADQQWARTLTQEAPYIVITPAASVPVRNWVNSRYLDLAIYVAETYQRTVFFCGGNSEQEQAMRALIGQTKHPLLVDLIGKTSLTQLLALLADADGLLSPDTGPAHMATMVKTPVVSLFANTNPDRAAPYNSRHLVVSAYPEAILRTTGKSIHEVPWGKRVWDKTAMSLIDIKSVKAKFDQLMVS